MNVSTARTAILIICVVSVVFSVFSWFPNPEYKDYVRTAIACVLLWFLYQGKNWARWVMGILLAFGSAIGIYYLAKLRLEPMQAAPLIIMTVLYAGASVLLISGKIVGPHFDRTDT